MEFSESIDAASFAVSRSATQNPDLDASLHEPTAYVVRAEDRPGRLIAPYPSRCFWRETLFSLLRPVRALALSARRRREVVLRYTSAVVTFESRCRIPTRWYSRLLRRRTRRRDHLGDIRIVSSESPAAAGVSRLLLRARRPRNFWSRRGVRPSHHPPHEYAHHLAYATVVPSFASQTLRRSG